MTSCPQCGRKVESAAGLCVCGYNLAQVSASLSVKKEPESGTGERVTLHVPLTANPLPIVQGNTSGTHGDTSGTTAGAETKVEEKATEQAPSTPSSSQAPAAEEPKDTSAEPAPPQSSTPPATPVEQAKSAEEEELEAHDLASTDKALHEEEEAREPDHAGAEKKDLHDEAEAEDATAAASGLGGHAGSDLHVEEEAVDVTTHTKLAIGEETPETQEEKRRKEEIKRRHKLLANVIGISVNAVLLLVVIMIVKCWMNRKPTVETEVVRVTVPAKQESAAAMDPTNAPPPPAVADQGEPHNAEGTPARMIEDALRARNALQCHIEVLKFNLEDGRLFINMHKEARWDDSELKKALDHDALLILRTAFRVAEVKVIRVEVEAPPARKAGLPPGELVKVLVIEVDRAAYDSSGLAENKETSIPASLKPKYDPALAGK